MPSYLYNIGETQTTIQEAINLIAGDLDNGWVPDQDIVINILDGIYAGFSIPNGTLLPLMGTNYRLIIQSAGNYFPIIDFNVGSVSLVAGADIGGSNPNVTIKNLRIQYFPVGIRADLNSHRVKVHNCIVSNNRNVGIFLTECNNTQIIQNIVVNGDYGIVSRLGKNCAILHNTVFLNGSVSNTNGRAESALWIQAGRDYGSGVSDTGRLYVIGNILWNTVGSTLSVSANDIETEGLLISDYNDLVVGDISKFISIEDDTTYTGSAARPRRLLSSLSQWKSIGYDEHSKSQDPRFITPVSLTNSNKYSIDLNLLSVSPVIGMVPSFFNDPSISETYLPSYVDTSDLSKDILNNSRQPNGTSCGANDRSSNRGFYGQDILTSPIESNISPDCGTSPVTDIIQKNLYVWYPSYNKGYFYSYDRKFYLYSRKECASLRDLAVTKFVLPSRVSTKSNLVIKVNGKQLDSGSRFDIRGYYLYINHKDLDIISFDTEVDIEYFTPFWKNGKFSDLKTYVKFKISEGETRYFLPEYFVPDGPVVITDDTAGISNKDIFCNREFSVEFDVDEQKSELIFSNNSNLVENPSFNYSYGVAPKKWSSSNALVTTGQGNLQPIFGELLCSISGYGYIEQILPISSGVNMLSLYSAASGSNHVEYSLHFYDTFNRDLGYVKTGGFEATEEWKRYYIPIGVTGSSTTTVSDTDYSYVELPHIDVPENSKNVKFRLSCTTGDIVVDALQLEKQPYPTLFHKKIIPSEYTVEYETSESSLFIDKNQNLAPSISEVSNGFIYIPEIAARCYDGPDDSAITTLFEWRWPIGRTNHIPWSRIHGKDKLKYKIRFSDYSLDKNNLTIYSSSVPSIDNVELVPAIPIAIPGDDNGVTFSIIVSDTFGNPSANTKYNIYVIGSKQEYPGLLHKKFLGLKEQLGQTILGYTSHAGRLTATWIPPSIEDSKIVIEDVPVPQFINSTGDEISFVNTRYPVNSDFHGNVTIVDSSGNILPIKSSSSIRSIYTTSRSGDYSIIRLAYPIVAGSVNIIIDNVTYSETYSGSPESLQFNVDYENSTITIKGYYSSVDVEYTPSYVFINQNDPYKIMFYHRKIFGSYSGTLTIGYDFIVKLVVILNDQSSGSNITKEFSLLGRNSLASNKLIFNDLALEF